MESLFVHSTTGLLHLIVSVLAMITGALVLFMRKGTKTHKKIGYVYVGAMLGVNLSALGIYRLFGEWGIFHYLAVFSLLTVLAGMLPILLRPKSPQSVRMHLSFMYWSVVGLYAAFAAESLVRIPDTPFFSMVGIASGAVVILGGIGFSIKLKKWKGFMNKYA